MTNKRIYGILPLILRVCVQYIRTSKGWGLAEQGIAVLHSLSWTAAIIATHNLFDAITEASGGRLGFWEVVAPLGVLASITVAQQVLSGAESFLSDEVSYKNMGKFMAEFQQKLSRLPAKNFEDASFLDDVNKAKECLEYESLGRLAVICLKIYTYYAVFFISVGAYLFFLSPMLPLVILAAFVPAVMGQIAQVKVFSELEDENAPLRRQCEYFQKTIADREFYKETRILGGFRYFRRLFTDTLLLITEKTWKTERKAAMLRLLLNIVSFAGLGASIFMLFNATMSGDISVGAFAAVFASLSQIFSMMEEIVSSHLSEASEYLGQVANYYCLMDMEEVGGEMTTPDFTKGIVASGVSFTYPGRNVSAIRKITITIKHGETIAIVGENGAGKSTLVRLLIGLYTPDEGVLEIGGLDSRITHPSAIYGDISGVFQHYQRYKMTLAENVAISDTNNPPNPDNINAALVKSEFNEDSANLGTMLSPEFDGIDLSGGQWQRLAIARGLYRTSNFIVLDEPTAAIDPFEEERIYNQFKRLSRDKCAIVVTHRLGSAKLADRIVVMEDGEIADIGTHSELVNRKGKYADMWEAQAAWYEDRI